MKFWEFCTHLQGISSQHLWEPCSWGKCSCLSVVLTFCCVHHLTEVTAFRNSPLVCSTVFSVTNRASFDAKTFVITSLVRRSRRGAEFKFIKYCSKRRDDRPGKSTGRVCRKHANNSKLSKQIDFIKSGLPCVTFSWQNYELQFQNLYPLLCVLLNTEPSRIIQAILAHVGPEIIFDDFKLAEAPFC